MQNKIFFSIIIPVYNRANFIRRTIGSVLAQSYRNFEIIVIDDGSTDASAAVVKSISDERIKYYYIQNSERAFARNYGFQYAKGDYITFLDSDDILYPDHFQIANNSIIESNFSEIIINSHEIIDESNRVLRKVIIDSKNIVEEMATYGNPMVLSSVFIRKDVFQNNKFNEDKKLSGSEDFELWLRLACKYRFIFSGQITSALTMHNDRSVLNFDISKLEEQKKVFLKYAEENILQLNSDVLRRKLISSAYSYISLHCSLTKKNKRKAIKYLFKALMFNPGLIMHKRFYAIIKHLIL